MPFHFIRLQIAVQIFYTYKKIFFFSITYFISDSNSLIQHSTCRQRRWSSATVCGSISINRTVATVAAAASLPTNQQPLPRTYIPNLRTRLPNPHHLHPYPKSSISISCPSCFTNIDRYGDCYPG